MDDDLQFNVQTWVPSVLDYVRESLTGGQQSANGDYSQQVRQLLKEETRAAQVLLTTSCTSALELSAMLLDLCPGDTVIVPSFTSPPPRWPSCARERGSCSATSSHGRWAWTRATSQSCWPTPCTATA